MDARVGPRGNGEEGVVCEGKTGWRFGSPVSWVSCGRETLLVVEFINSVLDWEDVFVSAGGVITLCNFACFIRKKGGLFEIKSSG